MAGRADSGAAAGRHFGFCSFGNRSAALLHPGCVPREERGRKHGRGRVSLPDPGDERGWRAVGARCGRSVALRLRPPGPAWRVGAGRSRGGTGTREPTVPSVGHGDVLPTGPYEQQSCGVPVLLKWRMLQPQSGFSARSRPSLTAVLPAERCGSFSFL